MKKYKFALAHICSEINEEHERYSGVLSVFIEIEKNEDAPKKKMKMKN